MLRRGPRPRRLLWWFRGGIGESFAKVIRAADGADTSSGSLGQSHELWRLLQSVLGIHGRSILARLILREQRAHAPSSWGEALSGHAPSVP